LAMVAASQRRFRRDVLGRFLWLTCLLALLVNAAVVVDSTWVVNYALTDWGLVSRFPWNYWLGLGLVVLLLFLGRNSCWRTAVGLGAVFLYLQGIPTFVSQYSPEWASTSRFNTAGGLLLARTGHVANSPTDFTTPLGSYFNWPGFLFQVGIVSLVTGWDSLGVTNYFPLVILLVWLLFVFLVLRVTLDTLSSLWGTIVLSAAWFLGQNALNPQGVIYILYLAFFLLIMKLSYRKIRDTPGTRLLLVLLFGAMVMSHPLTPIMAGLGVLALVLAGNLPFRKNWKPVGVTLGVIFGVIFLAHWVYYAVVPFYVGVYTLYFQIKQGASVAPAENPLMGAIRLNEQVTPRYLVTLLSSYLIVALIAIGTMAGLVRSILNKASQERLPWLAWIVGLAAGGATLYMAEGALRAYMFALPAAVYFLIVFVGQKRAILCLMVGVLLLLHIPAHWGGVADPWRTVTDTEISGRAFAVRNLSPSSTIFYKVWDHWTDGDPRAGEIKENGPLLHFSAGKVTLHGALRVTGPENKVSGSTFDQAPLTISELLRQSDYYFDSELQTANMSFYFRDSPLDQLDAFQWAEKVYDNGGFRVFKNPGSF